MKTLKLLIKTSFFNKIASFGHARTKNIQLQGALPSLKPQCRLVPLGALPQTPLWAPPQTPVIGSRSALTMECELYAVLN